MEEVSLNKITAGNCLGVCVTRSNFTRLPWKEAFNKLDWTVDVVIKQFVRIKSLFSVL